MLKLVAYFGAHVKKWKSANIIDEFRLDILKSYGYADDTGEELIPEGSSSGTAVTLKLQQHVLALQRQVDMQAARIAILGTLNAKLVKDLTK